jgi:hypothetical protein
MTLLVDAGEEPVEQAGVCSAPSAGQGADRVEPVADIDDGRAEAGESGRQAAMAELRA